MEKLQPLWSLPVAVEEIPETGLHVEIEAPAEARAAIAAAAGLRDLPRLSAVFDLSRRGSGVHVVGQVEAKVGQTCVVSLDPIENPIHETVDLLFLPAAEGDGDVAPAETGEPPETLVGGKVDLGVLATEFLALGLDPYPRKPGAEFAAPKVIEDAGEKPFAALAALKKRMGSAQP